MPNLPLIVGTGAGIISVALLLLGPIGTKWRWWTFPLGFLFVAASLVLATIAVGTGLFDGITSQRWRAAFPAIGLGLVAPCAIGWFLVTTWGVPAIRDITTDMADPPAFEALLPLRGPGASPAAYDGADTAAQQQRVYPDVQSQPVRLESTVCLSRAADAARQLGWSIVAEDAARGRLEATDTTFWFGFVDDVVVRVRRADGGSVVDVRSKSRVGRNDFGTNAKRIRAFLAALRAADASQ